MSSNKYIENVGCPECGSSDAVGVYERPDGSFFGKCFSCETVINNIYDSPNTSSESKDKVDKEEKYSYYDGSYNYLESRGITKEICEKYEVRSIVDDEGRDLIHFYPVVSKSGELAVCMREVATKKFRWINSQKELQFFGQGVVGSNGKMIIITEGVLDCLAAFQMLKEQGKSYRVVSVNNGAKSLVGVARENYEWLMSFESIFLCMDQDEPGQSVVEEFSALFPPNKVKNITFINAKDPNELLLSGKSHEFLSAIYGAKEARPEGIVSVQDLWDEAIKPPVHGNPFPWKTLTEATFGWRWGEVWGIGAGSGCGKCLMKGTKVRLYDGSIKKVEDIEIGDKLLSDEGFYNTVLSLGNGIDDIYKVTQSDNTKYFVNSEHILSVLNSKGVLIDINVIEAKNSNERLYGYNSVANYPERDLIIPPYILGIWLGDGHNDSPSITCGDEEVLNEWINYGESIGLVPTEFIGETNCRRINLSRKNGTDQKNWLYSKLIELGLPFNKHIPKEYLINSIQNRLELLAGLIDTDGSLRSRLKSTYEITTKYPYLARTIEDLCRSLGFRCRRTIKVVNKKDYFRVVISGNLEIIPCKVPRKQRGRLAKVDNNPLIPSNCSRIINIENVGKWEYYGFTLNGTKRFCLENYTVTHNTEFFKETISFTINELKEKAFVIFLEEPAAKTLKVLAGKKANKRFHVPADKGGNWTVDELKEGIRDLDGKVFLYNHFGSKDWDSLKAKIRYAVVALGTRAIFLDHLTALVAQEENEYKALNRIMEEMSSLCEELGCTIFYVSHLRKASGTPHEEGGRVTADQFKGSGAIVFWSHFLIGLERDQQAEDEDERNTTTLRVLKDRNTGLATGLTFKLKYNHETGRWGELDEDEYDEDF